MSLSNICHPRPEVVRKDGIEGVIDLENLRDLRKKPLEARPADFLELTYPTSDIRLVVESLDKRFAGSEKTPGLFLLEGYKGTGKSHLELLVYHLLKSRDEAAIWLKQHKLQCHLPSDPIVLIRKFTDFPIEASLWVLVFDAMGMKGQVSNDRMPNVDDLKNALEGKHLVLILDELERGIQGITNPNIRAQNLAFLQMISEEALRTDSASVTIFASVYNAQEEPGATLKRVPRVDIKFSEPQDRQRVALHRLFTNAIDVDRKLVEKVVQSYANTWRRFGLPVDEKYMDRCISTYPFSPELIEMVLFNVPAGREFQGSRGALTLLGSVVRSVYKKVDIITASHLNIDDVAIRNKLSDLDPVQNLIQCARNDLRDLNELPYATEIVSAVLAGTLIPTSHLRGLSEHVLARQVLAPGSDINAYHGTLQGLMKLGTFFQRVEDHYVFDEHEKPSAKVEYRSLRVDPKDAIEYALEKWRTELFRDSSAVIFRDPSQVRKDLAERRAQELRFVLSPRRLVDSERAAVFQGAELRNQIILLEPKIDSFNVFQNPDIIKWAQRAIAAADLLGSASDAERKRQYERILKEDTSYIIDAFKKAGFAFVWIQAAAERDYSVELEPLPNVFDREAVKRHIGENIFPRQVFEEHLLKQLPNLLGKSVKEIDNIYRKTLGFPIKVFESVLRDALRNLCLSKHLGLKGSRSYCGEIPHYLEVEWNDVRIEEPWETSPAEATSRRWLGVQQQETSEDEQTKIEDVPVSRAPLQSVETPFQRTIGALRHAVAERLSSHEGAIVRKVQFAIFSQETRVDLGTLPPQLRGMLSGAGEFTMDLQIGQEGAFSKADLEQLVERLPAFTNAQYRVEMKIEEPQPDEKSA